MAISSVKIIVINEWLRLNNFRFLMFIAINACCGSCGGELGLINSNNTATVGETIDHGHIGHHRCMAHHYSWSKEGLNLKIMAVVRNTKAHT